MLFWLIVSQFLTLGSLLPWFVVAGLSFMAFDSGFSWAGLLFIAAVWSYPAFILICIGLAWLLYRQSYHTASLISTSIPLLVAVPLLGFLLYNVVGSFLS